MMTINDVSCCVAPKAHEAGLVAVLYGPANQLAVPTPS